MDSGRYGLLSRSIELSSEIGPSKIYKVNNCYKCECCNESSFIGLVSIIYVVVVIVCYYAMDKPRDSFTVIYAQMNYKVFEVLPIFIFAFTCHQNVYAFLQKNFVLLFEDANGFQ